MIMEKPTVSMMYQGSDGLFEMGSESLVRYGWPTAVTCGITLLGWRTLRCLWMILDAKS